MATYVYLKKPVRTSLRPQSVFLSSLFFSGGAFLLFLVIWPIFSFEILMTPKLSAKTVSPLPEKQILGVQTDLTQASNWFPQASQRNSPSKITSYTLSIPKLRIKDATVVIGSNDLSKNLIQWGSDSLPGELGNTVIFGHSVLPAFFDPKNYMTIFSTLPTLKEKDEIYVYFDGITYLYRVTEMRVVAPEDLSVLESKNDQSSLSLITCVPPGTYWKRLIVKAKLINI